MPFFTQDSDRQDPVLIFRTGPTTAEMARANQQWEAERQQQATGAMIGWAILILFILAMAYSVFLHRRKIARSADAAAISGLATGVRAARAMAAKRDDFVARVLAKAAEKPPQRD